MRSMEILREELGKSFGFLHAKRESAIWRAVEALLIGGRLWLTALGRDMPGAAKEKHRIKAADRLLGNGAVHAELTEIYRSIAGWLLRGMTRPVVLVDWTGCGPDRYLLRAGLPIGGRSILLLSRVVSKRKLSNAAVHDKFLDDLSEIVPKHCRPIIVTDGGFSFRWFDKVVSLGWDFVGRLRGTRYVTVEGREQCITELFRRATKRPQNFGVCRIGRWGQGQHRLVLASKPKSTGRTRLTQKGARRRSKEDFKRSEAAREPWLLATSLTCRASKVIRTYATRMQLEEAFRDLKSSRFGWAFEAVNSKNPARTEVLLMIGTLASIALLAVGTAAERLGLASNFQANTVRKRRVLSLSFLGRRVIANAVLLPDRTITAGLTALRRCLQASSPIPFAPL